MIKIIKKIKNKGPAPYEAKGFRSGFVILFAVTLAAILLSIALGVSSIAQNEIKFGTSARETNEAFFAADAGIECALFYDKSSEAQNAFTGSANMQCAENAITPVDSGSFWSFAVPKLGNSLQSCARVTVDKTNPPVTTIISKGFNVGNDSCNDTPVRQVERELRVSYSTGQSKVVQNVTWTNAVGVNVASNSLTKTAAIGWGNAGASSVQSIPSEDGYVEFTTNETNTYKMAGLSSGDSNQSYVDIDYALYPAAGAVLQIYEKGVRIGTNYGSYSANDTFRVAVESGVVKYYRNGVLLYTSAQVPVYPLLLDTALYSVNSTIINAKIAY